MTEETVQWRSWMGQDYFLSPDDLLRLEEARRTFIPWDATLIGLCLVQSIIGWGLLARLAWGLQGIGWVWGVVAINILFGLAMTTHCFHSRDQTLRWLAESYSSQNRIAACWGER